MALSKEFVTAGRAVFTLEVPPTFKAEGVKPHYTYRVNFKKGVGQYKDTYFIQLLTGPDNTKSYSYLGILNPQNGSIRLTSKSCRKPGDLSVKLVERALDRVWKGETAVLEQHGFKLHHVGLCGRCGRALTVPLSIETGIGPECVKKMGGGNYPHLVAQAEIAAEDARKVSVPQRRTEDDDLERAIAESESLDALYDGPDYDEPDPSNEAEDRALNRVYGGNHDLFRRGTH